MNLRDIPEDARGEHPEDKFMGIKRGIVKKFEGSFGFIVDPERQDHFVHQRSIDSSGFRNLARGQHVVFYSWLNPKRGLYAKKVKVAE